MKKIFVFLFCLICINNISAKEFNVEFSKCVDGDTAKFIYKEKEITARFLAIDTPETVHPTKNEEQYGKEASDYTCNALKNAKKIYLEFDKNSDEKDKYDRYLVWVFVDGELLQKKLIRNGLANVAYLYDDYKYTNILEEAEQLAENDKLGIWNISTMNDDITEEKEVNDTKIVKLQSFIEIYKEYIILIGCLIIVYMFNLKSKKKISKKLKNKIKNDIKKRLK